VGIGICPCECVEDGIHHVIDGFVDLMRTYPKHAIALRLQPCGPSVVPIRVMTLAIDLYYESGGQACEVGEVGSDGDLAPKLEAGHLSAAES
jgi:hypothetical protein